MCESFRGRQSCQTEKQTVGLPLDGESAVSVSPAAHRRCVFTALTAGLWSPLFTVPRALMSCAYTSKASAHPQCLLNILKSPLSMRVLLCESNNAFWAQKHHKTGGLARNGEKKARGIPGL